MLQQTAPHILPHPASLGDDVLAARLNRLFAAIRAPGSHRPYRGAEVTEYLAHRGTPVSEPYLSQLRSGLRANPARKRLVALASFFGVQAGYLTGTATTEYTVHLEEELSWLELAHDPAVRAVTTALLAIPDGAREELLSHAESRP